MKVEVNTEHTYELDLGSDEEIKIFLKENGMPDINPSAIRNYIEASLYKAYCETMFSEEQLDKLVDATNFSRYINASINYNGRPPTMKNTRSCKQNIII